MGSEEARTKRITYLEASECSICWREKQHPEFALAISRDGRRFYVKNGFTIREDLKARGYRFGTVAKSWTKTLASAEELEAERLWVAGTGYELLELGDGKS